MKSLFRISIRRMLMISAIAGLAAFPAFAQESLWSVDANHSTAKIYLGSNSNWQEAGIALVRGVAAFNIADPAAAALEFSARLPEGQSVSFRSERVEVDFDGNLHVTGKMTLAGVERSVLLNPGEDYSGPIYGEPTIHMVKRDVTFVIPMADAAAEHAEVTAEAELGIENFPEMFAAVREANWQPVVEDRRCEIGQAGEDYRGAICSGKVLAAPLNIAAVSVGEDYRGFDVIRPSGNEMKLVLRLNLTRQALG